MFRNDFVRTSSWTKMLDVRFHFSQLFLLSIKKTQRRPSQGSVVTPQQSDFEASKPHECRALEPCCTVSGRCCTVIRLQAQNLYMYRFERMKHETAALMYSTLAQAALRRLALRCLTINITQEQQHDRHPQDRHQHHGAQGPCGPKD